MTSTANLQWFERLNASASTPHWQIAIALAIAQWVIWAIPIGLVVAWLRGDAQARRQSLELLATVVVALGIGQVIGMAWPQPRPFMIHLGAQFLPHSADPGFPSDHVTVFWSLACGALFTSRFAPWSAPLFLLGLVVGWSRVFLGVHFPLDVIGALPVAAAAAVAVRVLRQPLQPAYDILLRCWLWIAALDRRRAPTGSQRDGR